MLLLISVEAPAQVTYTRQDSQTVVQLLKAGQRYHRTHTDGKSLMLFYGHKLEGVPYVAHTLEVKRTEHLIVNLRELDCTTFTETVLALSLTTVQKSVKWSDYCHNLTMIRYENGKINGYPSRNHYFFWWVESNKRLGVVTTPMGEAKTGSIKKPTTPKVYRTQTIHIDWMTKHPSSYAMMKDNACFQKAIMKHEEESSGKTMMYIPVSNLGLSRDRMHWVDDGDILAICTKKKGLDTTHIGIAEWGADGKLHLLNASQIHKKVVLEGMTLQEYMRKHPVQIGVWVVKPVL